MASVARSHADVALLWAAVEAYEEDLAMARAEFVLTASRGRPRVTTENGRTVELVLGGRAYRLAVYRIDRDRFVIEVNGSRHEVLRERPAGHGWRIRIGDRTFDVASSPAGRARLVEVGEAAHRIARGDGGIVRAPAPAMVIAVHVAPGDRVKAGDPLVVLEAMKMEMSVAAPIDGTVRRLLVSTSIQVDGGDPLLQLQDATDEEAVEEAESVRFEPSVVLPQTSRDRCRSTLSTLRRAVSGFDVPPADAPAPGPEWSALCAEAHAEAEADPAFGARLLTGEREVLEAFADLCALTAEPAGDPEREELLGEEQELFTYLRTFDPEQPALRAGFLQALGRALGDYEVPGMDRTPDLEDAVFLLYRALQRTGERVPHVLSILDRRLEEGSGALDEGFRTLLDRLIAATRRRHPAVADLALEVRYRTFDRPLFERVRQQEYAAVQERLAALERDPDGKGRAAVIEDLVASPQPLKGRLMPALAQAGPGMRAAMLEILARRYYRIRDLERASVVASGRPAFTASYPHQGVTVDLVATFARWDDVGGALSDVAPVVRSSPPDHDVVVDLYLWRANPPTDLDAMQQEVTRTLNDAPISRSLRRVAVAVSSPGPEIGMASMQHFTFRPSPDGYVEERLYRGLHPMMGKRLDLWRLSNFDIERLPSVEDVYLFRAVAKENPKDERLFALAEVRDMTPVIDEAGKVTGLPHLERMLTEALAGIRRFQSHRADTKRLQWNRVLLSIRPVVERPVESLFGVIHELAPLTEGLGLEKVVVRADVRDPASGEVHDAVMHISSPTGRGLTVRFDAPAARPIRTLSEYMQKVVQMRQRGLPYPYEVVKMLAPDRGTRSEMPPGEFIEHDLDEDGRLVPVDRPYGENRANVVVGVIRSFTGAYPEGMTRVILLGDHSHALGSLSEPECSRINAALDLAEELQVPLEWFALSAGAKISMESGTENMDWIGRVLRRLIEFTQAGGEVNVVVAGINVGAQPYWNAEATMLMHTKGILVMTPDSAMVLTGKQALDYSGGVSAEDNFGIGGFERVMGPNGQAQYWAPNLPGACQVLLRHYDHAYRAPRELFPRRVPTTDPVDRDVRSYPHARRDRTDFATVGEIFSEVTNPDRKKPFDIRSVMRAVTDQDHEPLERWGGMRDAEIAVVWDAHLGGYPVSLLGLESRPLPRTPPIPADGPDHWTAGTLFPMSSKKVARAINAASGNRPVVVLANLSGFDGSPESLRALQLEYGAEIGRAVTNFRGPMVFCVISRYHGGAFVVFSATLNENLEVAAVDGSFASVIGGAPAAAVVFTREVEKRTDADPRVAGLQAELAGADGADRARLASALQEVRAAVRTEKLGQVAAEFDAIHSIERAQKVGSVHHIVPADRLRPYLVEAVERGMARELARTGGGSR